VAKPSYRPVRGRACDVSAELAALLEPALPAAPAAACPAPEPRRRNWFDRLFD